MARKRNNDINHLRKTVKKQQSIIKSLKKSESRANKRSKDYTDLEEQLAEELLNQDTSSNGDLCLECNAGKIETIDIGVRKLLICNNCNFRIVTKK